MVAGWSPGCNCFIYNQVCLSDQNHKQTRLGKFVTNLCWLSENSHMTNAGEGQKFTRCFWSRICVRYVFVIRCFEKIACWKRICLFSMCTVREGVQKCRPSEYDLWYCRLKEKVLSSIWTQTHSYLCSSIPARY